MECAQQTQIIPDAGGQAWTMACARICLRGRHRRRGRRRWSPRRASCDRYPSQIEPTIACLRCVAVEASIHIAKQRAASAYLCVDGVLAFVVVDPLHATSQSSPTSLPHKSHPRVRPVRRTGNLRRRPTKGKQSQRIKLCMEEAIPVLRVSDASRLWPGLPGLAMTRMSTLLNQAARVHSIARSGAARLFLQSTPGMPAPDTPFTSG